MHVSSDPEWWEYEQVTSTTHPLNSRASTLPLDMPMGSNSIFSSSCLLFLGFGCNHSCPLLLCIFGPFSSPLPPCSRVSSCRGEPQKASSFPSATHWPTGPAGTLLRLHQQILPRQCCQQHRHIVWQVLGMARTSLSRHNEMCPTAADRSERGYLEALGDPNYTYLCQTRLVSVDISAVFLGTHRSCFVPCTWAPALPLTAVLGSLPHQSQHIERPPSRQEGKWRLEMLSFPPSLPSNAPSRPQNTGMGEDGGGCAVHGEKEGSGGRCSGWSFFSETALTSKGE